MGFCDGLCADVSRQGQGRLQPAEAADAAAGPLWGSYAEIWDQRMHVKCEDKLSPR